MKRCGCCGEEKSLDGFCKDASNSDGKCSQCKVCRKEYQQTNKVKIAAFVKAWALANPDKRREVYLRYQKNNPDKVKAATKKWQLANPEALKKWYRVHRIEVNAKMRNRTDAEREIARQATKHWRKHNKAHRAAYMRKVRSENLHEKLLGQMRCRVGNAIRAQGKYKSSTTVELIGCDIAYLITHIAEQFKDGMSWDNYGEWQIDHKRPCASFDLTVKSAQLECFHFSNLQPLWKSENIKKNSVFNGKKYVKGGKVWNV